MALSNVDWHNADPVLTYRHVWRTGAKHSLTAELEININVCSISMDRVQNFTFLKLFKRNTF
jgi:hypothetical protein